MPARLRHLRRLVGLVPGRPRRAVMPMLLALSAAAAIAAAPVGAAPVDGRELYFSAGYERQVDSRTCTAAATAMMMNFIARRDLNLNQMSILRFEQSRDALNNAVQRGSDPLGWSRAATVFSAYTGRPRPTCGRPTIPRALRSSERPGSWPGPASRSGSSSTAELTLS